MQIIYDNNIVKINILYYFYTYFFLYWNYLLTQFNTIDIIFFELELYDMNAFLMTYRNTIILFTL